jgi:hypothetical protein
MKKSYFILSLLFLCLAVNMNLAAQSNDIIDALLAEEQTSYGKAAYLALAASGLITEEQSPEQALEVLKEQGWKLDILGAQILFLEPVLEAALLRFHPSYNLKKLLQHHIFETLPAVAPRFS